MREYIKTADEYGGNLLGFRLKVGSVYGRVDSRFFVWECSAQNGCLVVFLSRDNGKHWKRENVDSANKIYTMIKEHILKNGDKIPKLGSWKPVKINTPEIRHPQRDFVRDGRTRRELTKQNMDNCDFGGRMINPSLRHDNKNAMKVQIKDCDKPEWKKGEAFEGFGKNRREYLTDGMMHNAAGELIKK